ncbi:DNA-binding transcriptional regulator [Brucella endophytica]|uniref:DNA-binding transcriptional regulator n=1 Tax=Brucella endophytica TaxID=1963359 RepID=A0A916SDT0_9HYPH|nr:sugar-binding transcriptional regulator [Brucella endophytica]GGA94478.1 DNA-binding transcriptional regulator [Brucella endophytica]
MGRINELRLIARIAQMYHVEGKRQSEIAETMHMSQATVSRMLKRAEQEDIVRTTVIPPPGTFADLETALRDRYGLTEAIVIDCSEDRDGAIMARIGEAAAHFLEVTLRPDEIIGVSSWSQTLLRMADNIHPFKNAKAKYIVQILGGMGDASVQTHATQLTARLAKLTGGEPRLLLVQGITSSREAKLVMLADPVVRGTMDLFGRLSLAIIGIGAVEPSELLARSGNVFSRQEMGMLHDAGAVGEISFRFYDKDGKPVETPLNERVIGISLEDLRKADRVMALAGGESKTQAIAGALKMGIIDVFVTDKFTAARLTA